MLRRVLLICAVTLGVSSSAQAQDGHSLTEEFPHLTAKERSRIAQREAAEAPRDAAFQAVMRTAEELFQEGRYQESLDRYLEARRMRPYNVYPKVKAQDLQALLDRQAAEATAAGSTDTVAAEPRIAQMVEAGPGPAIPASEVGAAQRREEVLPEQSDVRAAGAPTPEVSERQLRPMSEKPPRTEEPKHPPSLGDDRPGAGAAETPDGIEERRYREGRADVLERRVTHAGQTTTYRRVRHPWGAVFHFKDGEPISGTAWGQVFPEGED